MSDHFRDSKYRPVTERVKDWKEVLRPESNESLIVKARECLDCGVPFCQSNYGCPVDNQIPDWNQRVHEGRWQEALHLLHSTNNFPEFTGSLCPAPCESACIAGINASPVGIRSIEWQIIEHGFQQNWVRPQKPEIQTGKRVAIIGSGPAGLAAAQQLARLGHHVVVFEKSDRLGGLLRYGIPDFKMEKWRIDRRISQLLEEGVEFKTSICVGKDISLSELRRQFHAVCLAMGAEDSRSLSVPGQELGGIHLAMDYLTEQNRVLSQKAQSGVSVAAKIDAKGRRVIILGGGDTGSDCLGTALRQGASSVLQFEILPKPSVERAKETPWPFWPLQLKNSHAHEEGGLREWSISTKAFVADAQKGPGVQKLIAEKIIWNGQKFEKISGSQVELEADMVILALGFSSPSPASPKISFLQEYPFEFTSKGIKTNEKMMTSESGIFAAGDLRRGASLIVWAIAEGRKMAENVDQFLKKSP